MYKEKLNERQVLYNSLDSQTLQCFGPGLEIITPHRGEIPVRCFPGNCLHFTCCPLRGHLPALTLNFNTHTHIPSLSSPAALFGFQGARSKWPLSLELELELELHVDLESLLSESDTHTDTQQRHRVLRRT